MTNQVTFPPALGGDGITYCTDDSTPQSMRLSGHRRYLLPMLSNVVAVGSYLVSQIGLALATMTGYVADAARSRNAAQASATAAQASATAAIAAAATAPSISLRNAVVIGGAMPGWAAAVVGGGAPTQITYTRGAEAIRLVLTWSAGAVTKVAYYYSANGGGTWAPFADDSGAYVQVFTYAGGAFTGATWGTVA